MSNSIGITTLHTPTTRDGRGETTRPPTAQSNQADEALRRVLADKSKPKTINLPADSAARRRAIKVWGI